MFKSGGEILKIPDYPVKGALYLYGLFFLLILVYYFLPLPFRYIASLTILVLFILSKEDYWWLALFFILYASPWGLFTENTRDAVVGIPLFSLGSGFSFSFIQVFFIISFLKALYLNPRFLSLFRSHFQLIFVYFVFLLLVAVLYGTKAAIIFDDLKVAVLWGFVFVLPALIRKPDDAYRFLFLVLPVVFLVFLDAVYFLFTGGGYIYYLIYSASPVRDFELMAGLAPEANIRFAPYGWHAILLGYIVSLALAQVDRKHSIFLFMTAIASFAVVIISATRSWFIIFGLIAVFTMWRSKRVKSVVVLSAMFLLLFFLLFSESTISREIFGGSLKRIFTVFEVNREGYYLPESMETKFAIRLPPQLDLIKQNPVTGWGFTENRGDVDVGIFGQWVEVGLVGLALFFYLWYDYIRLARAAIRDRLIPLQNRNLIAVMLAGFIGLLISHFTTNQIFGITYYTVFIPIYFWVTDIFLRGAFSIRATSIVS